MLERFRRVAIMASLLVIGLAMLGYVFLGSGDGEGWRGTYEKLDLRGLAHTPARAAWLLCDQEVCDRATPDGGSWGIPAPLQKVRQHLAAIVDADSDLRFFHFDLENNQFDITQFQRESNLNHVYVVKLVAEGGQATRVHLYSYQPIGESSKPANIARGERFLKRVRRPF